MAKLRCFIKLKNGQSIEEHLELWEFEKSKEVLGEEEIKNRLEELYLDWYLDTLDAEVQNGIVKLFFQKGVLLKTYRCWKYSKAFDVGGETIQVYEEPVKKEILSNDPEITFSKKFDSWLDLLIEQHGWELIK